MTKLLVKLKEFVLESSFIELSVAFILGLSFRDVINSIIGDWITPLLAAIGGQPRFEDMHFTLNNSKFTYGHFIDVVLNTIIIVTVIFLCVIYPLQMYKDKIAPKEVECSECMSMVPEKARKCKYCLNVMYKEEV